MNCWPASFIILVSGFKSAEINFVIDEIIDRVFERARLNLVFKNVLAQEVLASFPGYGNVASAPLQKQRCFMLSKISSRCYLFLQSR